jgi:O-antigen/teichoic acid export membrane protein
MGHIRRQTILSSVVIYIGFVIGFINTYLYVKNGTFTTEQYGLTRLFGDISITFYSFASLGVFSYIYKFYPFYKDNLTRKENDQAAWSVVLVTIGFTLVAIASVILKPLFVQKFSEKSRLLIEYYYWILPFTCGILFFTLFESFAWFAQKSIFTNFLKETGLRILQTVIILCFIFGLINFSTFIKIFSLTYPIIAIILLGYLLYTQKIQFNFKISRVTRKFYKKMLWLMGLIYGSLIVNTLAQYIDSIIIASVSVRGLSDVGIYTLATFITTTIQVPQRGIIAAVLPVLSNSWKKKDYGEIMRIYSRTSINLLLLALFIFFLIWLNIDDVFVVLGVNSDFQAGKWVIFILGISKIIDAGTGVNSQIIGTSNFWKFEVMTGILLLSISIPLNYFLVKRYGINGSAVSNLISFGIYNCIRLFFIWYKFKMQPFTLKTLYSILISIAVYAVAYYLFNNLSGWTGIIVRSAFFATIFLLSVFYFHLTPDTKQLWELALAKFKRK